jgi:16S rRNA (guanine527-N7)-methyltransferase
MGGTGTGPTEAAQSPVEPMPEVAAELFGPRLDLAERYADLLARDGVVRGVIGPHEAARIWSRHLLNCAAPTELFGADTRVVDVGSGAGLPGIVTAIRRPDLRVDLVEPLQRRVDFLTDAVAALGLDAQVRVLRGRADEPGILAAAGEASWVTARAVAPLDRLVRWCLPLLAPGGRLAFIKGAGAADEVERHRSGLARSGVRTISVVSCGVGLIDPPATVVTVGAPEAARRQRKGTR